VPVPRRARPVAPTLRWAVGDAARRDEEMGPLIAYLDQKRAA
jgi:hypothetical protein